MPSLPRRIIGLAVAVLLALAVLPAAATEHDAGDARVVIAAIDTPTNPYHEFFQTESSSVTPDVLAEFDIGPDQILDLTRTGNARADLLADADLWDSIEPGKPYWFEGTNLITITFGDPADLVPDRDNSDTHGVGVTAAALRANPEAIVVLAHLAGGSAGEQAETWSFTHPAVDIVTTSYGPIGSPPLPWHLTSSYTGVVTNGKLHFGAVDNTPALSPIDTTGGPWWSIGVAGYHEETSQGREVLSGSLPDFVGDFTQTLPYCHGCQTGENSVSGTSFATPRSAGTMSAVLLEARRAAGHNGGIVTDDVDRPAMLVDGDRAVTNWDLRRALEEGAYYPGLDDYSPGAALPVLDAAPWALTGWGAITPDPDHGVIDETLAHLGYGEATRDKGADSCAFMTALFEARFAYWNTYAVAGESWGSTDNPYVYC